MDANERYELLATQFKQATGLLAPGKDAPAAVGNDPEYNYDYRRQEWDKWLKNRLTRTTLTEMLRVNLNMDPECDTEAKAIKDTLDTIKTTFKEWLKTVGLPQQMSEKSTRQLLVTLVDEP